MRASEDDNLDKLLRAETPVVTIFGKTWDLHVRDDLRIPLAENLEVIHDTVRYLKRHVDEVIFDAEHFFDGYRHNPDYALECVARRGRRRRRRALPVRHQRRPPAGRDRRRRRRGAGGRRRRRSASTATTIPSWRWPTA